jgi:hypothetical protein
MTGVPRRRVPWPKDGQETRWTAVYGPSAHRIPAEDA